MTRFAPILFAAAVALATPSAAHAYGVSPIFLNLESAGAKSTARLTIKNTDADTLDMQIRVFRIDVDEAGKSTMAPADGDFVIFPPQASVPVGRSQIVQVRYVGAPTASAAYFVQTQQINIFDAVNVTQADANVKIGVKQNFNAWTIVAPPKTRPVIAMASPVQRVGDRYEFKVVNKGGAVAFLEFHSWSAKAGGVVTPLKPAQLRFGEQTVLAPNQTRIVSIDAALFPQPPEIVVE